MILDIFDCMFSADPNDIKNVFSELLDAESNFKGKAGEFFTLADVQMINGHFKILQNLLLPIGDKKTEIDLVVIHEKGLFVLESKNYGGWIYGKEENRHWTQSFNRNTKYTFYNPIMQNETHCDALSKALNISKDSILSYIVFSERCTLKSVPEDTDRRRILKRDSLVYKMNNDISSRPEIFSADEIERISDKLQAYKVDPEQRREHKERVKKYNEGYVCPKCGKALVLRKGQYGRFIGCSGFPGCRFTRPAMEEDIIHFNGYFV